MWSYAGLNDNLRICDKDLPDGSFKKQVCSLTKLTKKKKVPSCLSKPYDAKNPLPKVCFSDLQFLVTRSCSTSFAFVNLASCFLSLQGHMVLSTPPPWPEGGLPEESTSDDDVPKNSTRNDGNKIEEATERIDSTSLLLPLQARKDQRNGGRGNGMMRIWNPRVHPDRRMYPK
jgi:hypothetical protein